MSEAVIVATARSPIGRAFKGSLKDVRPDDLATQMVQAVLAKVPQLDPGEIEDLMLGCGMPGGSAGYNIARVVAVLAGMDHLPGTTVNRYCASSLQTTRMAMHAIKAGEGDVFVSAGVETVSQQVKGSSDGLPDSMNPVFTPSQARSEEIAKGVRDWVDPRERGPAARRLPRHGPDRRERRPAVRDQPRGPGRVRRAQPEPDREGDRRRVLGPGHHPGHPRRRHRGVPGRQPSARSGSGGCRRLEAGLPAGRHRDRGQRVPDERRSRGARGHVRHEGTRARRDATGPCRQHRRQPPCRRRSWGSAPSRPRAGPWPAPG